MQTHKYKELLHLLSEPRMKSHDYAYSQFSFLPCH